MIWDRHLPQGLLKVSWEDSTHLTAAILPLPLPLILAMARKKEEERVIGIISHMGNSEFMVRKGSLGSMWGRGRGTFSQPDKWGGIQENHLWSSEEAAQRKRLVYCSQYDSLGGSRLAHLPLHLFQKRERELGMCIVGWGHLAGSHQFSMIHVNSKESSWPELSNLNSTQEGDHHSNLNPHSREDTVR